MARPGGDRLCRLRPLLGRTALAISPATPVAPAAGVATLFVDGLRLDVAQRVRERLASSGLAVEPEVSLAALPTVTQPRSQHWCPCGEGALSPVRTSHPANCVHGHAGDIQVLRSLMTENGVQVLNGTDTGDPSGSRLDRGGRDRPTGTRRSACASGRLPRRRGRADCDPGAIAARRRLAAGRRRHRPRVASLARRHGEGRAPAGAHRGQEGSMCSAQGRGEVATADRAVVLGSGRADRPCPRAYLLRGEQGVRARRREPAGVHRAAAYA